MGKTNDDGVVLIPDLQAYYGNRLRVDGSDLPNDVQVDDEEVMAAPVPHGGARVVFESRRLRAVRGKLLPQGLAVSDIRYGELTLHVRGQSFSSPIGHDGEFELEGVPSGEWPADARSDTGYCEARIIMPVEGKPIENLGRVSCWAPGAAP